MYGIRCLCRNFLTKAADITKAAVAEQLLPRRAETCARTRGGLGQVLVVRTATDWLTFFTTMAGALTSSSLTVELLASATLISQGAEAASTSPRLSLNGPLMSDLHFTLLDVSGQWSLPKVESLQGNAPSAFTTFQLRKVFECNGSPR
jgi:hypothetical protein